MKNSIVLSLLVLALTSTTALAETTSSRGYLVQPKGIMPQEDGYPHYVGLTDDGQKVEFNATFRLTPVQYATMHTCSRYVSRYENAVLVETIIRERVRPGVPPSARQVEITRVECVRAVGFLDYWLKVTGVYNPF